MFEAIALQVPIVSFDWVTQNLLYGIKTQCLDYVQFMKNDTKICNSLFRDLKFNLNTILNKGNTYKEIKDLIELCGGTLSNVINWRKG